MVWALVMFTDLIITAIFLPEKEPPIIAAHADAFIAVYSFIQFAMRGFDNTERIEFIVNEQISLGGDCKYYITKETFIGKSKKPKEVEYWVKEIESIPNYCGIPVVEMEKKSTIKKFRSLEETFYDRMLHNNVNVINFDTFEDAMNECQEHKQKYDREVERLLIKEEQKKLSKIHTTNKYTI
jgi:hypothetical protein